jgi:hypothetical protein
MFPSSNSSSSSSSSSAPSVPSSLPKWHPSTSALPLQTPLASLPEPLAQPAEAPRVVDQGQKRCAPPAAPVPAQKRARRQQSAVPRGAITAANFFAREQRCKFRQLHPHLQRNSLAMENELNKALGRAWKRCPAAKRLPYEALAAADLERYWGEWLAYTPPAGALKPPHRGVPPPSLNLPKVLPARPKAAYMWFLSKTRRTNDRAAPRSENFKVQQKCLGAQWSALPPGPRAIFEQMSALDKQRYTVECAAMVASLKQAVPQQQQQQQQQQQGSGASLAALL